MERVRGSTIAGTWYPGSEGALRNIIDGYFEETGEVSVEGDIVGLISPHAGYVYSGQTAAYGYKLVRGRTYDAVVVLSPLHRMSGQKYVVNTADFYETPLGRIPVDKERLSALSGTVDLSYVDYEEEHSLEIQLPFLQAALGEFRLVPIMIGHGDVYDCGDLIEALVSLIKSERILLVASTDLHHIPDYGEVKRRDGQVVEALKSTDLERIRKVLGERDCSVCGRVPVSIVIDATKRTGAQKIVILHQTNSGDITGDRSPGQYTVGYLSAAIVR